MRKSADEKAIVRFRDRLDGGPDDIKARALDWRDNQGVPNIWRLSWWPVWWRGLRRTSGRVRPSSNLWIWLLALFLSSLSLVLNGATTFNIVMVPVGLLVVLLYFMGYMQECRQFLVGLRPGYAVSDEEAVEAFISHEVAEVRRKVIGEASDLVRFRRSSEEAMRQHEATKSELEDRLGLCGSDDQSREALAKALDVLTDRHDRLRRTHERTAEHVERLNLFFDGLEKRLARSIGDAALIARAARQAGEANELSKLGDTLIEKSVAEVAFRLRRLQSATPRLAEATAQQLAEHPTGNFDDDLEVIDRTIAALVEVETVKV